MSGTNGDGCGGCWWVVGHFGGVGLAVGGVGGVGGDTSGGRGVGILFFFCFEIFCLEKESSVRHSLLICDRLCAVSILVYRYLHLSIKVFWG